MRWKAKYKKRPKLYEERVVVRWIWFPTLLNHEWRWLEIAEVVQYYGNFGWDDFRWK